MSEQGLHCKHINQCANCSQSEQSVEPQKLQKMRSAESLFQHSLTDFVQIGPLRFRDHYDLRVQNQVLGFMSKDKEATFSVDMCPLGSEALQKAFEQLKKFHFPVHKGSLRLRVSPFLEKPGLWLDFSHLDVKALFEERRLLRSLSEVFHVEIGQRRKALEFKNENPHLKKEPESGPWSQSFFEEHRIPLFGQVASFTQTGASAIEKLSLLLQDRLKKLDAKHILELGAGLGTLTFPALSEERKVSVVENDLFALNALKYSQKWIEENLQKQVQLEIFRGDFQRVSQEKLTSNDFDTVLVNPPRSGLMKSAELIQQQKNLIYVSCSAASAAKDHQVLSKHYKLTELIILDQFPWTTHFELVLIYQKI